MPFSILHFSDLHLDVTFATSRLPAQVARQCRERLRGVLKELVDLAKARRVDAVTIAGDLFERERITPDTASLLYQELERLAPTPVFIAPGNHDASDVSSLYQRGRWPDNVQIALRSRLTPWQLSKDYVLWSAAHVTPSDRHNFLEGFELPRDPSSPNYCESPILLLHATTGMPALADSRHHAPLTVEQIKRAGFSLALLGHFHGFKQVQENGLVVIYPGSPEPLGFTENDRHGAVLVEMELGHPPVIEFVPTAQLRFDTLEVAVDDCENRERLVEKVAKIAQTQRLSKAIVRVVLTGYRPLSLQLDAQLIESRLQEAFAHIIIENLTRPAIDREALTAENTVRGQFVREVLALIDREPEKKNMLDDALSYGLQAFEQEEITLR